MSEPQQQNEPKGETAAEPEPITFAEFLESVPPSQQVKTIELWKRGQHGRELEIPQLQLHCNSDTCNGPRFFRYREGGRNFYQSKESLNSMLGWRGE
jgi:hypothetical protein